MLILPHADRTKSEFRSHMPFSGQTNLMVTTYQTERMPAVDETVRDGLTDTFGRVFDYLRIALTDRCNFRCIYCLPEDGIVFSASKDLLAHEELTRIITIAANLGIHKIRFTGGEPLPHPSLTDLVAHARLTPGIDEVHITTNGSLLAQQAGQLYAAGLDGINVSLDTLRPDRFKQISRRLKLSVVIAGIDAAIEAGFTQLKLNIVALRGVNDDEISDFVQFGRQRKIGIRFIELMPFDAHQIWKTGKFMSVDHIREELIKLYPQLASAQGTKTEKLAFQLPDEPDFKVALIPAYSRTICESCNRIRITADGQIRNCLFTTTESNLRDLMREGANNADIEALFRTALAGKLKDGWEAQKVEVNTDAVDVHIRDSMTQIGG